MASASAAASPVYAADLRIASWGGSYQASQREAFFKPFQAETGHKIVEDEWGGEVAKIRAMVEAKTYTWDVLDSTSGIALQACDEGMIETIDWSKMGVAKENMVGADANDCGVPNILYSFVVSYDTTKLPNGPQTVADFFDLEKFPGKRGMWKNPNNNLEFALLADGVPVDQVYAVLSTPEGVDRAFAKLDTIKSSIVWWEAEAQSPQLLADGEVIMTTGSSGRVQTAIDNDGKPFKIMWHNQLLDLDYFVIPKGSPNLELAYTFLSFASQPARMAEQTKHISYGPSNKEALPMIDMSLLPHMPTSPENMKTALLVDAEFWGNNGEELKRRFNTWMAQ